MTDIKVNFAMPVDITMTDEAWEVFKKCTTFLQGIEDKKERDRLLKTLQRSFDTLGRFKAKVYQDFAPLSFYWRETVGNINLRGFEGGLIFHGQHDNGGDGGAPTFSVCLTKTSGWSIHT